MPITNEEALRDVRGFAAAGRVRFTKHARVRIAERCGGVTGHVMHALKNAKTAGRVDGHKWRIASDDLDGAALEIIVVLEDGLVIVTLF